MAGVSNYVYVKQWMQLLTYAKIHSTAVEVMDE